MSLIDRIGLELWQLVGDEEVRPKNFTMNNARRWQFEMLEKYPAAKKCALSVKRRGDRYEILQALLDEDLNMIKTSRDMCVGRRLLAYNIDQSVTDFLGGETSKLLD